MSDLQVKRSPTYIMVVGVCIAYAVILTLAALVGGSESVQGAFKFIGVTAVLFVLTAILPLPIAGKSGASTQVRGDP